MAALAYLLPPVTGLVAYFTGSSLRTRWHGLQSIAFGLLWPALMFAGSAVSAGAAQLAFGVGTLVWLVLLAATATGMDPKLPGGSRLKRAAERSLREE
jgi:hypothetical protein